jgi:anti-sigma B factor antagonist
MYLHRPMTNDTATPSRGRVTIERHDDGWIVALHGEHDVDTLTAVREQLADVRAADRVIVVDLTAAAFLDSSVLGALFDAYRADIPPRLRFVAPSQTPPRRLFDFVGLDTVIPIFERLQDALTYKELG